MDKVCVVLCEGQHDIAFISRVLKAHGFDGYDSKIRDFIPPFNNLFAALLNEKQVSDRRLGFSPEYKVPSVSLCKNNETLVFFHNMGGDDKQPQREEVVEMYKDLKGEDDFTQYEFDLRFLFFFDADEMGVEQRISNINQELGFTDIVKFGQVSSHQNHEWGSFIFHGDELKGDLEDLLLELISQKEAALLTNSKVFIDSNKLPDERQKEYICTPQRQAYKTKCKFKQKKSLLSIAGQLQFSGMSNAVFIANTDYLSYDILVSNAHCTALNNLFV
ncbi:conserved hypothetical protein [Vibrio chagasii]|nr:conserved hypothetical protein [Vibrio chagasii]CAH7317239.1 conserved hypothetical protein [Vibrio chagasii]CAH7437503.1 conserved hypothetical protein [Vibrio chagasii]